MVNIQPSRKWHPGPKGKMERKGKGKESKGRKMDRQQQNGTQGQGQGVEGKGEAPIYERRSRIPLAVDSAYLWHRFWKGTGNGKGKGKSKTEEDATSASEDATGTEENATGAADWLPKPHILRRLTGCGNPSHHIRCKGTRDPSCKYEFAGSYEPYLEILHPSKRARSTDDGP
jgi:hypothetical protein